MLSKMVGYQNNSPKHKFFEKGMNTHMCCFSFIYLLYLFLIVT